MTFATAKAAKVFLVERIVGQAVLEGSPLSKDEITMLYYSADERSEADNIAGEFDEFEYEAKMGPILARALSNAKQLDPSDFESMQAALRKLSAGDHYLSVIASHSSWREIQRPKSDKIIVYSVVAFSAVLLLIMFYSAFTK